MINAKFLKNNMPKRSFLRSIFIYFLIPISMVSFSALGVYKYYKVLFEKELESNYLNTLDNVAQTIDNSLIELQNTTLLLSSDINLYNLFYSGNKLDIWDNTNITSTTKTLTKFKTTKSLIDDVFIVHKDSNEILGVNGTYNADVFFSKYFRYDKYNAEYWMKLKVNTTFYDVLKPSFLTDSSYDAHSKRKVIPFVTSNLAGFKSDNLFVINLSSKEIASILEKYKFLPNSTMAIIDKSGIVYSSSEPNINDSITTDTNFLSKLSGGNFFEYNVNGEKVLVVSYSSKLSKFNNFIYTAFIPYDEFYRRTLNIKNLAYTIIFSGVVFSILVAYLISRKIYSPIDNLINILKDNDLEQLETSKNEVEYLGNRIRKILSDDISLRNDLSIVMPLASEQYLIKILTNSDSLMDEAVKNFIYNSHINFKYSDFCVSLIEIKFTDKYYSLYDKDEYLLVMKGISKMFGRIALDNYPTYILNINSNQLCLLVNLPKEENLENITFSIRSILDLFEYDSDLLSVYVGIGRIYMDFVGMNKSFNEARKALATVSPLGYDKIKIYAGEGRFINFHYSISDENKLFNYLLGNYKDESISFLNLLIDRNYKDNISENTLKKFYSSIYDTILRVTTEKELDPEKLMGEAYVDFSMNVQLMSLNDINSYILLMVNKLLSVQKSGSKVDIYQISEYIKAHYSEDLYLEKLAEIFGTSDKYLSRLFKETMGMGFHEYLTSIRISKAKELLLETNYSVTKIGEMIGFTTHSTFFRIFKKYEGINPTQFRDNNKK